MVGAARCRAPRTCAAGGLRRSQYPESLALPALLAYRDGLRSLHVSWLWKV